MQHQLRFRESLLPFYEQERVRREWTVECDRVINQLEALKQNALAALGKHKIPPDLRWRFWMLSGLMTEQIALTTPAALMSNMGEEVVTAGDVECARCCMKCNVQFVEGDVAATLLCTHGFHHECLMQWLELSLQCPFCGSSPRNFCLKAVYSSAL